MISLAEERGRAAVVRAAASADVAVPFKRAVNRKLGARPKVSLHACSIDRNIIKVKVESVVHVRLVIAAKTNARQILRNSRAPSLTTLSIA
jgi:hypothetical protein